MSQSMGNWSRVTAYLRIIHQVCTEDTSWQVITKYQFRGIWCTTDSVNQVGLYQTSLMYFIGRKICRIYNKEHLVRMWWPWVIKSLWFCAFLDVWAWKWGKKGWVQVRISGIMWRRYFSPYKATTFSLTQSFLLPLFFRNFACRFGPYWEKLCPLSCVRPRAVSTTSGTVFPTTDLPSGE